MPTSAPAGVAAWAKVAGLGSGWRRGARVREPRMPIPRADSRTLAEALEVVVVLDESGSTASSDPDRQSHQAVLEIADWLDRYSGDARDRIGVVRFADRAAAIAPVRAKDAGRVLAQELAHAANVGGGTRLTPAVQVASQLLARRRGHRLAVLATDGQVVETTQQLRDLFAELQRSADAVYLVALDHNGAWSRSTYTRYENLGIADTLPIGALGRAHLAHAIARVLMQETGLRARGAWQAARTGRRA